MERLSIAILRELVDYDAATGDLRWRPRDPKWFKSTGRGGSAGACARWNGRFAGKAAFVTVAVDGGHLVGRIFGECYRSGPVAWAIHNDKWPSRTIDHWDGDPTNNRIGNLRDVSQQQTNMMNRAMQLNNTSGVTGVFWSRGRWQAAIKFEGRSRYLGRFDDLSEAARVRKTAEQELGFTARHGTSRRTMRLAG